MKHKLHQLLWACFKGKTGGGGQIASPTELPCFVPLLRIATPWIWCVFSLLLLLLCGVFIVNVFLAVHIRALPLDLCVWKSPLRRIPTLADRWRGCVDCLVQHSLGTRTIRLGWSPEAKGSTNGSCGAPGWWEASPHRRGRGMVRGDRVGWRGRRRLAVNLHVFAQRARVCVRLVTTPHFTEVRLIACVDVRVLLPVTAVGEFPVTAIKLTFERFLTWQRRKKQSNKI